jgi:hypothetical protein
MPYALNGSHCGCSWVSVGDRISLQCRDRPFVTQITDTQLSFYRHLSPYFTQKLAFFPRHSALRSL